MKNRHTIIKTAILAVGCFALLLTAQAVSPPPDGGYSGQNTAEGKDSLFSLTSGTNNTANGFRGLYSNTTGSHNTGIGSRALRNNMTGFENTATGSEALLNNTDGSYNTASGRQALFSNQTGSFNTASGVYALFNNTDGGDNTADGHSALYNNTSGFSNIAVGEGALFSNTSGIRNTACGLVALYASTGSNNVALGYRASENLTTGDNNIDIGNLGMAVESNTIRIGGDIGTGYGSQTATFIAGISGTAVAGSPVFVTADGQLGVGGVSSRRFKENIKPMDKNSEAILALKPVSFRYKKEIDPKGVPQFGLVAEDVAKVNPDLVVRDAEGKVYSVRYDAVNAMLLNEFLKEHRQVQEQQKQIEELNAELKAQANQIRKVNDKVEMNRPAPKMALSRQRRPKQ